MSQKKAGIIFSYVNMLLNIFISIFFTPFLIRVLGDAEYGVYRIVQSFAGQLSIMTFGVCSIVTRNVAFFDAQNKRKEKENFLFMALCISVVMAILVGFGGSILYSVTDKTFSNSLSEQEILTAKTLVLFFVINTAFIVLSDGFIGIIIGRERFVVARGIKTVQLILRVVSMIVLLRLGFKSVAIVAVDLLLSILNFIFYIWYCLFVLKEKIKFYYFDKKLFKTSIVFSCAVLFQALINRVNQNMDSAILGIMVSPEIVTMYSLALTLYTTYNSLSISVSTVFIPQATKMVVNNATPEELTDLVAYTGRYGFMISGLILTSFVLFGRELLNLWVGPGYDSAYVVTLILIIPMTIPLVQNTCECILDAKLKRMSQSLILLFTAIVNLVLSVVLILHIGYIGAAIGTATSVILGNVVMMNIFYHKSICLKIGRMFKKIFHRLLLCVIGSCVLGIPLKFINLPVSEFFGFCIKVALYMVLYFVVLCFFGINSREKSQLNSLLCKLRFLHH